MNRWECEGDECDRTVGLEGLFRDGPVHWALCPRHKATMEADGARLIPADESENSDEEGTK